MGQKHKILKVKNKFNGTRIGAIFTGISILLTFTYFVPLFTMIPATQLESLLTYFIENAPYSNIGIATIWTLSILLLISLITISIIIRKHSQSKTLSNKTVTGIMAVEYFIIHSLGFYIYWGYVLNFSSGGEKTFASLLSFPISSFGFLLIGIGIDLIKIQSKKY